MKEHDVVPWLLEPGNPSVRYLALTELLGQSAVDPEVVTIQSAIPGWGPARAILDARWPEGYWMRPGIGYSPRYRATIWQVIFLAAMGTPPTEAIERACAYVLDHSRLPDGRFSAYKTARGAVTCLNGNLLRAMLRLGHGDLRVQESLEAMAEMVDRDGFRCRFNAIGTGGGPPPVRMGDGLPCAWGAIKVLGAFSEVPEEHRSATMRAAVEAGVAFLLDRDLASGDYPTATGPSPLWRQFGFPLGYTSDLLEALAVLQGLGRGRDSRLAPALRVVLSKRDKTGRWALEHTPGRTWGKFGKVGEANKWVTLRALCALKNWNI